MRICGIREDIFNLKKFFSGGFKTKNLEGILKKGNIYLFTEENNTFLETFFIIGEVIEPPQEDSNNIYCRSLLSGYLEHGKISNLHIEEEGENTMFTWTNNGKSSYKKLKGGYYLKRIINNLKKYENLWNI